MNLTPDKVTLITCTGHRKEAFKVCHQLVTRQMLDTNTELQWIVINDEYTQEQINEVKDQYASQFELIAGPRLWQEGMNTQRFNMEAALPHVRGDYVLIIEDDDYYSPRYVQTMVNLLKVSGAYAAGEANAKYYHIEMKGWKELKNFSHSSLAATALRREALPILSAAINSGNMYFDIEFWNILHEQKIPSILLSETNLVVGMKGVPGRVGIGVGHKRNDYLLDPAQEKLKEWIGTDVSLYTQFIKETPNESASPRQRIFNNGPAAGSTGNSQSRLTISPPVQPRGVGEVNPRGNRVITGEVQQQMGGEENTTRGALPPRLNMPSVTISKAPAQGMQPLEKRQDFELPPGVKPASSYNQPVDPHANQRRSTR